MQVLARFILPVQRRPCATRTSTVVDMPTSKEPVAHGRTVEEVREAIGCDAPIYQDVEAMKGL